MKDKFRHIMEIIADLHQKAGDIFTEVNTGGCKQACRNPGMLESRIPARCDIYRQFYHLTKII